MMYPDTAEFLKLVEKEIEKYTGEKVDLQLLNEIDHLIFNAWNDGWMKGFMAEGDEYLMN